jgi:RNA polymerase sigma-70 factor (ECF subfamily)
MTDEFELLVAPLRGELLTHCYRLTGARSDAEDALQDALVRAWRAFDKFAGRSTLRTWLYKIATNACIDLLASRRARTLPERVASRTADESTDEPVWLEPYPQPDAAYASREAIGLAFVVALQVLPPRQRATLILRDVVGLSAEETATALDTSVAAVNSALQRARAVLDEQPRAKPASTSGAVGKLLGEYLRRWESGDAAGLVALLCEDATLSMPPLPMSATGPQAIAAMLASLVFSHGPTRLVACTANGSPAFGVYANGAFVALSVLDVDGDRVASIRSFLDADPTLFGLPRVLDRDAVPLAPGAVLGRYCLDCVLGSGGMGEVWRATDLELGRAVALKVLRADLADDEQAAARLVREARALAMLRHPNVVTVFDAPVVDGRRLIIMEIVDGESLGRWASTRGEHEIVDAMLAAGRGLAAAHAAGLVHRDFKPDNVLVARDGRVLVVDFGIARTVSNERPAPCLPAAMEEGTATVRDAPSARRGHESLARGSGPVAPGRDELTREGTVLGTPSYMAPEQLCAEEADARTDQFAFCISMWELLAGARPFDPGDLTVFAAGEHVELRHGERLPSWLRDALVRGLSHDRAARWPSMDALLDVLAAARPAR